MQFIEVDKLPIFDWINRTRYETQSKLEEFMAMNIKYARVVLDEGEYASVNSAYQCIRHAAIRANHPILVSCICGEVYLMRTDM
jgi:hypothetical protein